MQNVQLIEKATSEAFILAKLDDMVREHFNAPADPVNFYYGWFDCVGFRFALYGADPKRVRESLVKDFDENVTVDRKTYYATVLDIFDYIMSVADPKVWRD